jgi:hypothetical protein
MKMKYNIDYDNSDKTIFHVSISGSLERGHDLLNTDKISLLKAEALKKSQDSLVVLNLEKLIRWDTEGIWSIMDIVQSINKKNSRRVGIVAPKVDRLRIQAENKVEGIGTSIPWEASFDKLIAELEK